MSLASRADSTKKRTQDVHKSQTEPPPIEN